ncbi:ATP-grasp domain-containing protein [Carboxylicivirga sp. N1Y90]|uniref:ATP-grasp domain-containing protein n=1 Tax=Carboxylicivirga fragile TaxID=3417571 RepID=UPI003D326296|nr:ATP-grasp domain-containing protein [Marinilabiliaceae bacterium N1Y90]
MIIIDKPYVSEFLIGTIKRNQFPVLENEFSRNYQSVLGSLLLAEDDFVNALHKTNSPRLYSNSENAIAWIADKLSTSNLSDHIAFFKDKCRFREGISSIYPDFFFKEIELDQLDSLNVDAFKFPFIIKPSTGFFSMGVYKVNSADEWDNTKNAIRLEIEQVKHLYPTEVLDTNKWIIEEYIEGDEFAFDAYYDANGEPVLLNSYKHYFASSEDVSDRVYYTSKQIIIEYLERFTDFLKQIGDLEGIKNFPVHVEVRINERGEAVPIEVNPMRFGGWCTTADLTEQAFGINPYEYYLNAQKPNWDAILSQQNDDLYSVIVLDNSTGVHGKQIEAFNYDKLTSQFSKVLELRKVDYKAYPVFGFIYAQVKPKCFHELERICQSDLKEFI